MEFKLENIRSMEGDAGFHVERSSNFDLLKGRRHFAELIPATEKKDFSTKEMFSLLETKGSKRITISMWPI